MRSLTSCMSRSRSQWRHGVGNGRWVAIAIFCVSTGVAGNAPLAQELGRLASEALPALHPRRPAFMIRELSAVSTGGISRLSPGPVVSSPARTVDAENNEADQCVLFDIFTAPRADSGFSASPPSASGGVSMPRTSTAALHIDVALLQQKPYETCRFRVLWARGRGGCLDWFVQESILCDVYDRLLIEDEFLLQQLGSKRCWVLPLDPHEAPLVDMVNLPWSPGSALPKIDWPLVSFHAYTAYLDEAQSNPQRWLQDPDSWHPHLLSLVQEGRLKLCMAKKDCENDQSPYRLMFWEDISSEFVDCVAHGITPVFFVTPANHEYVDRNVVLVPYTFQTQEEMLHWVRLLSSPEGVMEYGTRVFMQRESNHILSSLYWRQDVRIRALLAASASLKQSRLSIGIGNNGPIRSDSGSRGGAEAAATASAAAALGYAASTGRNTRDIPVVSSTAVAELMVCVVSASSNRHQRDIIRNTWGHEKLLRTAFGTAFLRVLFFVVDDGHAARSEHEELEDVVLLQNVEESFSNIWLKTAAVLKYGSDYFRGKVDMQGGNHSRLQFLLKCDDDAFIDIDAVLVDLLAGPPVGIYWGHIMALVEPNRLMGDKYFVPIETYPRRYYPPYARGMAYALSEDLVTPLGDALFRGLVEPFPYREDVSVGLYLLNLSQRGEVKVAPQQRKDAMPIDFPEYCSKQAASGVADAGPPLLVLHRFRPKDASCLWAQMQHRRSSSEAIRDASSGAQHKSAANLNFCSCLQNNQGHN